MDNPKISIITACFNEEKSIEASIESVLLQTYPNIEYIIIDGNSTDNTMNIVNRYRSRISTILSEPDKGIYDAFNKGVSVSTGEIVYFLNTDLLYDKLVVKEAADIFSENNELNLMYGNVELIDEKYGYTYIKGKEYKLKDFENSEMVPHQGVFLRRRMFDIYGKFNINYRICSDFDFIIKCFKGEDGHIRYFDRIIARCREGGISSDYQYNYLKATEFSAIINKHFSKSQINPSNYDNTAAGLYRMWLDSILLRDEGISSRLKRYNISNIAIFGTMKTAMLLYKDLQKENYQPVAFLDNNMNMQGRQIEGIKVYSPEKAIDEKVYVDCIIVSIENSRDVEIIKSLRECFGGKAIVISWKDLVLTRDY